MDNDRSQWEALSPRETRNFFESHLALPPPRDEWDRVFVHSQSDAVKAINLDGLGLKKLDLTRVAHFAELTTFSLYDNFLTEIDVAPLAGLPVLETLNLSCNDFGKNGVDLTPIAGSPKLKVVDLGGDITLASAEPNLARVHLAPLPALEHLHLEKNALREVDLTPLIECPQLRILNLRWNHLERVNLEALGGHPNLEELALGHNKITSVPAAACQIPRISELDLSFNQLETVPDELGFLASLEKLSLDHNPLERLPASIGNLANLKILSLSSLPLLDIPASIAELDNLEALKLDRIGPPVEKFLRELPDGGFKHLKQIQLAKNKLEVIPESIQRLKTLQELNLSFNELQELPPWLPRLENLQVLKLDAFKGKNLPSIVANFPVLREFSLRNVSFPINIADFDHWENLEFLHLSPGILSVEEISDLNKRGLRVITRDFSWID